MIKKQKQYVRYSSTAMMVNGGKKNFRSKTVKKNILKFYRRVKHEI